MEMGSVGGIRATVENGCSCSCGMATGRHPRIRGGVASFTPAILAELCGMALALVFGPLFDGSLRLGFR